MSTELFNHADRSGFIERLGALQGKTTYREPGGAGHQPHVSTSISSDNAMVLALSLARRNPRDVGPDIAYSIGTGQPHNRHRVVHWLAEKLEVGTGSSGRRSKKQLLTVAAQAYELVLGVREKATPPQGAVAEFTLLVNVGAGWLWVAMESAVERAENALHGRADEVRKTCA